MLHFAPPKFAQIGESPGTSGSAEVLFTPLFLGHPGHLTNILLYFLMCGCYYKINAMTGILISNILQQANI